MSEVWLHNPNLPGQDIKVPRGALGTYGQSGWQEREDQSDPIDPDTIPAEPATAPATEQDAADTAEPSDSTSTETTPDVDGEPAADKPAASTTTKKGR